jgi:hypothetical protein
MISVFLKTSISIAIAFVVATLLATYWAPLTADIKASFANTTASLFDRFGLAQTNANQPTPLVQSNADTETFTAADKQPPAPNKSAASAPTEPVVENLETQSDVLFRQFQAWAAAQENVPRAQPDQDVTVAQSAPAKLPEDDAMPHSIVHKRKSRPAVIVRSAPTKMSLRNSQKQPRPLQNARAQVVPAQSARAQEPDQSPRGRSERTLPIGIDLLRYLRATDDQVGSGAGR